MCLFGWATTIGLLLGVGFSLYIAISSKRSFFKSSRRDQFSNGFGSGSARPCYY